MSAILQMGTGVNQKPKMPKNSCAKKNRTALLTDMTEGIVRQETDCAERTSRFISIPTFPLCLIRIITRFYAMSIPHCIAKALNNTVSRLDGYGFKKHTFGCTIGKNQGSRDRIRCVPSIQAAQRIPRTDLAALMHDEVDFMDMPGPRKVIAWVERRENDKPHAEPRQGFVKFCGQLRLAALVNIQVKPKNPRSRRQRR